MEEGEEEAPMVGSLQVPSVQELAKETLTTVPPRYLRPDQDPPFKSDYTPPPPLPVIDLHKLFSEESELNKLHSACREWGFFQLINHGVNLPLVEKLKSEVENFFHLPLSEKKKYYQKAGDVEGFGQAFVMSEEQKLDWADMFFIKTLPIHSRKQHLLPELPLPFRETLEAYSAEVKDLAMKIINLMAKALRMEVSEMTEMFEEGTQSMRMNHYPPCPQPDLVMGLNSHSDGGGLTILLHLNQTEGLQIKKDGKWVPVKPLPNAFTVNIGDVLEILTNGVYQSIEHRATVNSVKERFSIATFHSPAAEAELGPAPSLVSPETPPLFTRIRFEDYKKGYLSRQLNGKSYIDGIRIPK